MTPSKTTAAASGPPEAASATDDPVPAEVRAVIELYTNQLAKVSFPDIDAGALQRQAEELRTQSKEVARVRQALDAALEAYVSRLATLTETATRAVAYARIYSLSHPDQHALASAIAALSEPAPAAGASATAGSKRRSRPSRRSGELFESAAASHRDDPV